MCIRDSNKVLSKVINKSLPTVVKNGDLHSLSGMANSILGKSLDIIYPNFANDLAKAFGYKSVIDVLDPHADYNLILGILNTTNPNWDVFSREDGRVGDVGYHVDNGVSIVKLQNSSTDFRDVIISGIKSEPDHHRRKMYALVQFFRRTSVNDQIMKHFPSVSLMTSTSNNNLTNNQKKNRTVDPRALTNIGIKVLDKILK